MKLKEVHEVMNTIRGFTADDATVIFGSVIDQDMGDNLRVTIVATGLGGVLARSHAKPFAVVKNGTDNSAMEAAIPCVRGSSGSVLCFRPYG